MAVERTLSIVKPDGVAKNLIGERSLEPSDVADAVLYLSSPMSDLVQGQTLVIDAGASILV